jgi:hypothetical protein
MSNYSELLKSPKWQRKRLEILERDNFKCVNCGSEDNTLHVHHHYYESGKKPWEYPDRVLITLCEGCHYMEEIYRKNQEDIVQNLCLAGWTRQQISSIGLAFTYHSLNPDERRNLLLEVLAFINSKQPIRNGKETDSN